MRMNWLNTSFWVLYGFVARNDPVIYAPNAVGLVFGLIQAVLCCIYPGGVEPDVDIEPLLATEAHEESTISPEASGDQEQPSEVV